MNTTTDFVLYPFKDPNFIPLTWAETQWLYLVRTFGEPWLFVVFYLSMTLCYLAAGFMFWVAEKYRLFPEYRVQPGKWPQDHEYIKTLKNIAQNYVIVILPMCFLAPPGLEYIGISAYTPLPSGTQLFIELCFCMLIEDIFQYVLHRMLHIPSLYPLIHKVHHEWTTPFGLSASYAHPAEVLILAVAAFAGPLMIRHHLCSFFAWLLFRQMDAVKTHCGWVWPGIDMLLHKIPSYEGAVFHDYHHKSFIFNYASRFTFIDRLFGTYKVPYDPMKHLDEWENGQQKKVKK